MWHNTIVWILTRDKRNKKKKTTQSLFDDSMMSDFFQMRFAYNFAEKQLITTQVGNAQKETGYLHRE